MTTRISPMSSPHGVGKVAIERALSKLGIATRSEARRLVLAGRVALDGRVVRDPRMSVRPETARFMVDGVPAAAPAERVLMLLHKPTGVVTTRRDPEGRRTVYDLIQDAARHLVPVGRLDAASTGLLLLTDDTRLADWLTDPRQAIPRVYLVTVRGRFDARAAAAACTGVEDREDLLRAHAVTIRKASGRETHLVVELRQGRNREIRRLCAALGHEVTRLKRVSFGSLELGDLAAGAWRWVAERERREAFPLWFTQSSTARRTS